MIIRIFLALLALTVPASALTTEDSSKINEYNVLQYGIAAAAIGSKLNEYTVMQYGIEAAAIVSKTNTYIVLTSAVGGPRLIQ